MKNNLKKIILLLIALKVINVAGQTNFKDFPEKPHIDSNIVYGQLSNGLKYYIKPLENYQGKLNLRFYVKAGSNNEDPDQMDFAHFVEHMAFESSDNFPKGLFSDLKQLEKLGMTLYDFNGTASPYFSKYIFKSPQGNTEALETGLSWFGDIAGGLHLKDDEIDEERGVMLQEVLHRSDGNIAKASAKNKFYSQMLTCRPHESNFTSHYENSDSDRLRQFYKDWYRPELMAIFVAGKVENTDKLVERIERNFSHVNPEPNPRKAINCDSLYFNRPDRFVVVANKGVSLNKGVRFDFYFKDPLTHEKISEREGVQRLHEINLLTTIINKRLIERTNSYNNFSKAWVTYRFKDPYAPSAIIVSIDSKNENDKKVIQEVFEELKKLEKYGVLREEFDKAIKQELIKIKNKDEGQPHYWLTEMEKHFVYEEYFPNEKSNFLENWLANYTLEEFQKFLENVKLKMPDDIGILAPQGHPALNITEGEVRSWIRSIKKESLSPYIPMETPQHIMSSSEVTKLRKKRYEDKGKGVAGTRELVLKNGVKVILNSFTPSPGPNENKIFLHGYRGKGALSFPPKDYFSAINAPGFIKNSGLRELDKFQLQKFLSKTSLWWHGIKPYIKDTEAGIKVDADMADLETMLQLVYSYFSYPRIDSTAFKDWKTHEVLSFYDNKGAEIDDTDLNNNIRQVLQNDSKFLTGTERFNGLDKTNMKKGYEIYRDLFGGADDFTFLISGDYSIDVVLPLVNKYLGNLPNRKNTGEISNNYKCSSSKLKGPVLIKFSSSSPVEGNNFKYRPLFINENKQHIDWKETLTADALGWVFNSKIIQLRFDKNFSLYTAGAYSLYNEAEKQLEFGASISCLPEEYPLIRQEFSKMVNELKERPVPEELFEQGIKRMLVEYDPSGKAGTQEEVQTKLYNHYKYGIPWVETKKVIPFIKSLKPKDIQFAAKKYLKEENLYEFVMTN